MSCVIAPARVLLGCMRSSYCDQVRTTKLSVASLPSLFNLLGSGFRENQQKNTARRGRLAVFGAIFHRLRGDT